MTHRNQHDEDDLAAARGVVYGLILGLIIWLVLAAIAAGVAHGQTLTVVNDAHVSPKALSYVERAVTRQANGAFRRAWHTPPIRFGRGGLKIYLHYGGSSIHSFSPDGTDNVATYPDTGPSQVWGPPNIPFADVATDGETYDQWSVRFDHEVLEMLVNPYGTRTVDNEDAEACDNADGEFEADHGVWLADWLAPSQF